MQRGRRNMCLFFKLGNESPSYSISTAFKILQGDEKGEKRQFTLYLQTNFYQETWNYFKSWNERIVKVRFTQKMLVKLSHHHSSEHFFAPGHLIPINDMNTSEKMSNFSFFCIYQISLFKVIQICNHVIINNFLALQAL